MHRAILHPVLNEHIHNPDARMYPHATVIKNDINNTVFEVEILAPDTMQPYPPSSHSVFPLILETLQKRL